MNAEGRPGPTARVVVGGKRERSPVWSLRVFRIMAHGELGWTDDIPMMMRPHHSINITTLHIHARRVFVQNLSDVLFNLDIEWRGLDLVE